MLIKEFIQLRRDRVSFGMIVMVPLIQLMLFGYAINTTAALSADGCAVAGAVRSRPFDPQGDGEHAIFQDDAQSCATEEEFDELLKSGKVLFGDRNSRAISSARMRRGDRPAMLVAADATDPIAAGTALERAQHDHADRACRTSAACRMPARRCSKSAPMRATIRRRRPRSTSCPA